MIHTLHLNVPKNHVGDGGARSLVALKAMPALHTLHLNFEGNEVGKGGAQALAALRDAPALRTLRLDLRNNHVGDGGAQALAALAEAPALQELHLNLQENEVGVQTLRPANREALEGTGHGRKGGAFPPPAPAQYPAKGVPENFVLRIHFKFCHCLFCARGGGGLAQGLGI